MAREKKNKPKKKQRRPGRKSDITDSRVRVLVKAIGCGLPKMHAARLAKISDRSLNNWLLWGEEAFTEAQEDEDRVPKARKLHVRLFLGVRKAVADTMQDALNNIAKAGEDSWQASAWLLTRLCPGRFADQRREFQELKKTCAELAAEVQQLRNLPPVPRTDAPQTENDAKSGAAVAIAAVVVQPPEPPKPEDVPSVNVVTPVVDSGFPPAV